MKKILLFVLTVSICFSGASAFALAGNLSYSMEKESPSVITDCAYNGSVYVAVGSKGLISTSEDLSNWTEISNVCYSDINKIIWDGSQFVFISNYNVYRSFDGYNWVKQECEFTAGDDFAFIDDKYLVRKPDDRNAVSSINPSLGFTSDFSNFDEIAVNPAGVNLVNAFAPQIYVANGIYFAFGRTTNIVWSQDLTTWNLLPLLGNESDTTRKRLLFTFVNGKFVLYFYEKNTIVRYSIDSLDDEEWEKVTTDIDDARSYSKLLQTSIGFYCFGGVSPYNSSDGIGFDKLNQIPLEEGQLGLILVNDKIINFGTNTNYLYDENTNEWLEWGAMYQSVHQETFIENLYWTGKEYMRRNLNTEIIEMTTDKVNFYDSGITAENYKAFRERYAYKMQWTGEHYLVNTEYGGNAIWLYDELLNLASEHTFDGNVMDVSFCDGIYYVRIGSVGEKIAYLGVYSSENFQDWTLEDNLIEAPKSNGNSTIITEREYQGLRMYIAQTDVTRTLYKVNHSDFAEIAYETKTTIPNIQVIGNIYVKRTVDSNGYLSFGFSNDGVYFVEVPMPKDFSYLADVMYNGTDKMFYLLDDKIIYNQSGWYITFDINEIRNAINIANPTYVKVNNKLLGFDTPPVIENDRTLVPLRFIFETLGAEVDWDANTQSALVESSGNSVRFSINDTNAKVNGQVKTMDIPARLIESKTMVPLRFLSEELGFKVHWDEENRIATISE